MLRIGCYLATSFGGMSFLAQQSESKNMSHSQYNLSGRRIIDDITQLDLLSPMQLLQDDATDEIKTQKLVVGSSINISGFPEYWIELRARAPYGIYFGGQYFKQYKSVNFSFCKLPDEKSTFKKLPHYLPSIQTYMDAVVIEAKNTPNGPFINQEYLKPLIDAEGQWKKEEFQTGKFGHIDKYKDTLDLNNLNPELRDMIPYFTKALRITSEILQNSNEVSLQEIYEHGPQPTDLFISDTDVIGYSPNTGTMYTSWGSFNIGDTHYLPKTIVSKQSRFSSHGCKIYIITQFGNDGDLFVNEHLLKSDQTKITESWIAIRDFVFYQLQQGI